MDKGNSYNTSPNTSYNDNNGQKTTLSHERSIVRVQTSHEQEMEKIRNEHEIDKIKKQLGWLGVCFGGNENTALNISGALLVLLIIFGVCFSVILIVGNYDSKCSLIDMWSVITPIITLALGYIFGNKHNG